MNLFGAIGTIMENTGLSNILETIYKENSILHLLKGKAVSRALRGHFITDQCLSTLIAEKDTTIQEDITLKSELDNLYSSLKNGEINIEDVDGNNALQFLRANLKNQLQNLTTALRTASLWLNYQYLLELVRNFIRADHVGIWQLHLETVFKSLQVFASTGHHNYAKSVYLYLQNMYSLKDNNPDVYKIFSEGNFGIRRSDRNWAGLAPDLVTEQVLMRSLKSNGGSTRVTDFKETQRAILLLSMPISSTFNLKMQELTDVYFETSEQHKSASNARILRDNEDIGKVLSYLKQISPFTKDGSLRNIAKVSLLMKA